MKTHHHRIWCMKPMYIEFGCLCTALHNIKYLKYSLWNIISITILMMASKHKEWFCSRQQYDYWVIIQPANIIVCGGARNHRESGSQWSLSTTNYFRLYNNFHGRYTELLSLWQRLFRNREHTVTYQAERQAELRYLTYNMIIIRSR